MLRTILGIPFVLICYLFILPGMLFGWLACKIRGKNYPGISIKQ